MAEQNLKLQLYKFVGILAQKRPVSHLTKIFFHNHSTIIYYHGVWNDNKQDLFGGISLQTFTKQIDNLRHLFEFVSLESIINGRIDKYTKKPPLAITFDDGFDLITSGAVSILDARNIKATVFINPALTNYNYLMWQHALTAIRAEKGEEILLRNLNKLQNQIGGEPIEDFNSQLNITRKWPMSLKDNFIDIIWDSCGMTPMKSFLHTHHPYLDWQQIDEWLKRGHSLGLHTFSHPFCSDSSDAFLEEEIFKAYRIMCEKAPSLSLPMPFAYPFGERLPRKYERKLIDSGLFNCLLDTGWLSRSDTNPFELSRLEPEYGGIELEIMGRPLLRALRNNLQAKLRT